VTIDFDNPWVLKEETHGLTREHVPTTLDPVMHPLCFQDLIEHGTGILHRVIPAVKDESNPVMVPETPWETNRIGYVSVIREPESGRWRMWYGCEAEGASGTDAGSTTTPGPCLTSVVRRGCRERPTASDGLSSRGAVSWSASPDSMTPEC